MTRFRSAKKQQRNYAFVKCPYALQDCMHVISFAVRHGLVFLALSMKTYLLKKNKKITVELSIVGTAIKHGLKNYI
jgi:hypothetical protein